MDSKGNELEYSDVTVVEGEPPAKEMIGYLDPQSIGCSPKDINRIIVKINNLIGAINNL